MNLNYIDTHSHLQMEQFDEDREEVIVRMHEQGVATIAVGVGLETSKSAVALAEQYPDVVVGATIGVHPTDTDEGFDPADYEPLLASGKVVGIGECGFDYFRTPREEVYESQKEVFEKQIQFVQEHNLPLMLHVRPSKGSDDAHDDALALLREYTAKKPLSGTSHFFTGSLKAAKGYWDLGLATSFPGVITFVTEVVAKIAELRGEELEVVKKRLLTNSNRIFNT